MLQDFYFIDKILDVGGVIIFDDCGGSWPGIQRVARFVNSLPHYNMLEGHNRVVYSFKRQMAESVVRWMVKLIPFKKKFYPSFNFKTDTELGLNYACLAFQKMAPDGRQWNWDRPF